jgi:hypothetical protein
VPVTASRLRRPAVLATICLVATLVAGGLHQAANANTPTLTRIRVAMTSTSDWSTLTIPGASLLAAHVAAETPGSHLTYGKDWFMLRGPDRASGVVDAVLLVPVGLNPALTLAKGYRGHSEATVDRTVSSPQTIARMANDLHTGDGPYAQTLTVDRSALVGPGFNPPRVDDRRLVLAFYYPWWSDGSFRSGYWVERPTMEAATDNAGAVATQVRLANQHGIDGFVVSWDGAGSHPQRFDLALQAAEQRPGFVVAPYLEVEEIKQHQGTGPGPILHQLLAALGRARSPAFLHARSRPVVFIFDANRVAAQDWATVRRGLAAAGEHPFLIADDAIGQSHFDGFHYYNPNGLNPSRLAETYLASLGSLRLVADVDPTQPRRLWAATVSPGENNKAINYWNPTVRSRQEGATYDQTWQAALASFPDWVLVTTWNEWLEDTAVAPGTQSGPRALNQTLSWSAQFHGGG